VFVDHEGTPDSRRDFRDRFDIDDVDEGIAESLGVQQLVFFVIARRKFSGSSESTKVVAMPSLRRFTSSSV